MRAFIFKNEIGTKAAHSAHLPPCIKTKSDLMDALSAALHFPDYFGRNWDALSECIRDLSWLPPGDVALRHSDLPLMEDLDSLSTYLSILSDAVQKWKTTGSNLIFLSSSKSNVASGPEAVAKRQFLVTFPPDTEKTVAELLS